jgi:hypothetical protein
MQRRDQKEARRHRGMQRRGQERRTQLLTNTATETEEACGHRVTERRIYDRSSENRLSIVKRQQAIRYEAEFRTMKGKRVKVKP